MTGPPLTYESFLRWRAQWLEKQMHGKLLVRSGERDLEMSRQGKLKRYVTFDFTPDTALINWSVFVNDIHEHSGRHKHQGGLILFILAGSGSTEIDGKRHHWKRGDLLLLPIIPGGIEHQHFNDKEGEPCRWVAFYYRPFEDWVCHTMSHIQDAHVPATPSQPVAASDVPGKPGSGLPDPLLPEFYLRPQESRQQNLFDSLMKLRDAQRHMRGRSTGVLSGNELAWEINPHGIMRWYLHPLFMYTTLRNFSAYMQYIPSGSCSGLQRHPGDKVFFFLQGNGHTAIDGTSYQWGAEDLLMLPIRPHGVTYRHFNDDPQSPAFLFACEPNLAFTLDLDRGSGFEELEAAPEFQREGSQAPARIAVPFD